MEILDRAITILKLNKVLRLSKDIHSNQKLKNKFKKTHHVGDVVPGAVPGLVL